MLQKTHEGNSIKDYTKKVWVAAGIVTVVGSLATLILSVFARPILVIIYGSELGAVSLLRMLLIAIPLDFIATAVGITLVSRGYDKFMLFSLSVAAVGNIICNLVLIPRMGAMGAAIATLVSYVALDICVIIGFIQLPVFAEALGKDNGVEIPAL